MKPVPIPDRHFIPGYTGYCPQYRHRVGKTWGKLTYDFDSNHCVRESPILLRSGLGETKLSEDKPTPKEIDRIKTYEREGDTAFTHLMQPKHDCFIASLASTIGQRYLTSPSAGVAEHEELKRQMKCNERNVTQRRTEEDDHKEKDIATELGGKISSTKAKDTSQNSKTDVRADSYVVYHRTSGMMPNYMGHVPGEIFKFGRSFGKNTLDAKFWLTEQV